MATIYVTHDYAEALSLGDRIGVMGNGGLVQVGSAREVFERPCNIFVARHLGQPSINEISCRIADSGGQITLQSASGSFAFAAGGAQRGLLQNASGNVLVGIRPQHVSVANGAVHRPNRQCEGGGIRSARRLGCADRRGGWHCAHGSDLA